MRPTSRGDSSLGHKTYTRATIEKCPRTKGDMKITFKKEERKYVDLNYDNAMIVSVTMINT